MKLPYLTILTISEIAKNPELKAKYRLTEARLDLEEILLNITDKIIGLPPRESNISKKQYKQMRKQKIYEYLLSTQSKDIAETYRVNFIDNNNLDYEPLAPNRKHLIVSNNNQDWVRTINSSKRNASTDKGENGIVTEHNNSYCFIDYSFGYVYPCEILERVKRGNRSHSNYIVKITGKGNPIRWAEEPLHLHL